MALLGVSLVGVGWGWHLPASPGTPPAGTSRPAANPADRVVCIAHTDVQGGVIPLFPLQPGRVVKVEVQDNQKVTAGAPLFRLDDTIARQTVAEAEADLVAAEANLKLARQGPEQQDKQVEGQQAIASARERDLDVARLKRDEARRLVANKLAREETAQMAEEAVKGLEAALQGEKVKLAALKKLDPHAAITRAEQDVKVRQARLAKAKFGLSECTLTAPCDGVVLRLLVSEGETLGSNPQQPAVYFRPNKPLIIRAEVEQEFADRVRLGQAARIQDDTRSSKELKGHVTQISGWFAKRRSILMEPLQFNDVRTLECIIELDSPPPSDFELRIGQRMRVTLEAAN
jgi:multidrug resistance efflux pump